MTRATILSMVAATLDRTPPELAAGVTPVNYAYPPGDVRRYGADPTGAADSSAGINAALSINATVFLPGGTYLAHGLIQTNSFQRVLAQGEVTIKKNANGVLLTSSGSNVEWNGVGFRGDASSPTFTGDNLNFTGDNVRLINCGSRWCSGIPLKSTGNHTQVIGTCDIYQTTDASGTGYDIVLGKSGTATLYHAITDIFSSQSTGGIRTIDCGSCSVQGSQFGKLLIDSGTSPAGVNGGTYTDNRILGNVTANIASSSFAANTIGAVTVTFAGGTSGHTFDASNALDNACTIVDNSTNSNVEDLRLVVPVSYTPTWTAATVNPTLGNGTLVGYYQRRGRIIDATIDLMMGSTTTYGTGGWYFALPAIPTTAIAFMGSALGLIAGVNVRAGISQSLQDGTARCIVTFDSDTAQADSGRPAVWATNCRLRISLSYST